MLSFNSFHLCTTKKVQVQRILSLTGQLEIIWNFTCYVLSKCFIYGKGTATLVFCKPLLNWKKSGYMHHKIWKMSLIVTPIFSIHLWTSFFIFVFWMAEAWMFLLWFSFLVDTQQEKHGVLLCNFFNIVI